MAKKTLSLLAKEAYDTYRDANQAVRWMIEEVNSEPEMIPVCVKMACRAAYNGVRTQKRRETENEKTPNGNGIPSEDEDIETPDPSEDEGVARDIPPGAIIDLPQPRPGTTAHPGYPRDIGLPFLKWRLPYTNVDLRFATVANFKTLQIKAAETEERSARVGAFAKRVLSHVPAGTPSAEVVIGRLGVDLMRTIFEETFSEQDQSALGVPQASQPTAH